MALTPRIAIPVPTSIDLDYNRRSFPLYLDAITRSGGEPVPVQLDDSAASTAASCDAVVLPGSLADVRPSRYGQDSCAACGPADLPREAADLALLNDAERFSKPVLGICYGLQSINVWRGGTLLQDLTAIPVNHAAGSSVAVAHSVLTSAMSRLGSLIGPAKNETATPEAQAEGDFLRLPVNSSHHQAVGAIGDSLVITARCPQDGVIEAIELTSTRPSPPFFVAVQWHPERSFDLSPASRALFSALIEAAQG